MPEAIPTGATAKAKPRSGDIPKYEIPSFDLPNLEIPAAFREIAEKGVAQAKENYAKFKSAAEEATDVLEDTYAKASKGASDYGQKVIEHSRTNTNAAFDLFGEMLGAKSLSEMVELSSTFVRSQFETVSAQAKDLAETAQKAATETAEPIKQGFGSALRKAA